jgi:hypothetical protein
MLIEGMTDNVQQPIKRDADGNLCVAGTLGGSSSSTGFVPTGTVALSATVASARVQLAATGTVVVIRNYGPSRAYVKLGGSGISAAVTDYPVDPYTCEVLGRTEATETYLAALCDTGGTATLSISTGTGGFETGTTPAITGAVAVSAMPASATATLANVAGSASSVTVLAANTERKGVVIHNDSTAILYLKFGTTASATSFSYKLNGGETFESAMPVVYTGIITGIWASATGAARVTELT